MVTVRLSARALTVALLETVTYEARVVRSLSLDRYSCGRRRELGGCASRVW